MPSIKTINIKFNMPTVDEARRILKDKLIQAYSDGVRVVKVVHGYGSTGKGGKLKDAIRNSLRSRKKEGLVEFIIFGENFNNIDKNVDAIIQKFPYLKDDPDYKKKNEGITIVVLAKKGN